MKILNFTVYFDEKTHQIKRIVVHSEWCDYNCKNCPHESLCDRIHDAIVAAETAETDARCSDCAFIATKAGRIWCGITGERVDPNRQACGNLKRPEDMTAEEIAELNSKPWNRRWNYAR